MTGLKTARGASAGGGGGGGGGDDDDGDDDDEEGNLLGANRCALHMGHRRALQQYIPASVHRKLGAGQGSMLAETRQVSCLFTKVTGCNLQADPLSAHAILRAFQAVVYR